MTLKRKKPLNSHQRRNRIKTLIQVFGNRCVYCNVRLNREHSHDNQATVDHIIPLSLGGTNFQDNIILACFKCNSHRQSKSFIRWLKIKNNKFLEKV